MPSPPPATLRSELGILKERRRQRADAGGEHPATLRSELGILKDLRLRGRPFGVVTRNPSIRIRDTERASSPRSSCWRCSPATLRSELGILKGWIDLQLREARRAARNPSIRIRDTESLLPLAPAEQPAPARNPSIRIRDTERSMALPSAPACSDSPQPFDPN